MLSSLIHLSLRNRAMVLLTAVAAMVYGTYVARQMPVDVFPDLNRPTITVMTEAPGLAPEEVESLVTRPIELLLGGASDVLRIRSSSTLGLSIVWVEFDWGTDVYRDRQIVAERLQLLEQRLPDGTTPIMTPITSIMGEIMLIGLRLDVPQNSQSAPNSTATSTSHEAALPLDRAMQLRTLAEFPVRNRLLGIEGVSQVTVMGGVLKQYQVLTNPARLSAHNVTLEQLVEATQMSNVLAGGGVIERSPEEMILRFSGKSLRLEDIAQMPIGWRDPTPVRIGDVADVRLAGPIRRGDAAIWSKAADQDSGRVHTGLSNPMDATSSITRGGPAVILAVQKQPKSDTLELDRAIRSALSELSHTLPADIVVDSRIFAQAEFIDASISNVTEAVRDGAIWVVIVLFLLIGNLRSSLCSLIAMPMSILLTFIVFRLAGVSINTMTLGGVAVAIGDLVDDSIVDIENIHRRLKENALLALDVRRPVLDVVYAAACEVRSSIVHATMIVILVACPLFAMAGLEGRLFAPLGFAYIVSLGSSLVVSLTLTPVLGSMILPRGNSLMHASDPWLLSILKRVFAGILKFTLRNSSAVLAIVAVLVVISCCSALWMGGEFLPSLNEGTLTVNLRLEPGASLDESRRIASRVESRLLTIPEVISIGRRTGRAELDEHAEGVNSSELEVRLAMLRTARSEWIYGLIRLVPILSEWSFQTHGRSRAEVIADVRREVSLFPGVTANIGQPISHRLDHVLSGIRAQIAVKVFGEDLATLRSAASMIHEQMESVVGVVDLQVEPQVDVPQVRLEVRRAEAARYGLAPRDIAELIETAYKGRVVSQVLDGDQYFGLVVWFDESARSDIDVIRSTIIKTPSGRLVALDQVTDVIATTGPNTLNREQGRRRTVVACNVEGRDLDSVVNEIRSLLRPIEARLAGLPGSYGIEIGGEFAAMQQANQRLAILGLLCIAGIFSILCSALRSWRSALQVLVNIPLAAFGSIAALLVVNCPSLDLLAVNPWYRWPALWIGATNLSVAHWIGFITLTGIVCRNGIMMISHYHHLMEHEGEQFSESMIMRGSLERLAPVIATALTSFIGLLPLLARAGDPGKELLHPMAVVVFGGMLASTLLDQLVTPALFFRFGRSPSNISDAG